MTSTNVIRPTKVITLYKNGDGELDMKNGTGEYNIACRLVKHYFIDHIEFCYEPLQNKKAAFGVDVLNWLPRNAGETLAGRKVASRHHRYIHFSASLFGRSMTEDLVEAQCYPIGGGSISYERKLVKQDTVWGTMEHLGSIGTKCCVYGNYKPQAERRQARVHIKSAITPVMSIVNCFSEAWIGPYDMRSNNCIDYAVGCWNLLCKNDIEYDNVCQV